MATLLKAHHEWSKRAADERFPSLESMHAAAVAQRDCSRDVRVEAKALRFIPYANGESKELRVTGNNGSGAQLTQSAFAQACGMAGAPAEYLAGLPATLAADALNYSFADRAGNAQLLVRKAAEGSGDPMLIRAFNGPAYSRVHNADITSRLLRLKASTSFQEAPAAFDGSRGQYMGERDMFSFMVDNDRRIFETLPGGGLSRGFFAWNSETGHRSIGVMTFLYEFVCGNHRVWGAKKIKEVRVRHVGEAAERFGLGSGQFVAAIREYAESSESEDVARIERARAFILGSDKEEVLDRLFGLRLPLLTRKLADETLTLAEQCEDKYGHPRSVWGVTGALTEIARDKVNADERFGLEQASAKLLAMAN